VAHDPEKTSLGLIHFHDIGVGAAQGVLQFQQIGFPPAQLLDEEGGKIDDEEDDRIEGEEENQQI